MFFIVEKLVPCLPRVNVFTSCKVKVNYNKFWTDNWSVVLLTSLLPHQSTSCTEKNNSIIFNFHSQRFAIRNFGRILSCTTTMPPPPHLLSLSLSLANNAYQCAGEPLFVPPETLCIRLTLSTCLNNSWGAEKICTEWQYRLGDSHSKLSYQLVALWRG